MPTATAAPPPTCPRCGSPDVFVFGLFRPGEPAPTSGELFCWAERRPVTIVGRAAPAAERED